MSDQNSQIKSPGVILYNASGQQIATSIGYRGLFIVDFSYKFDDEDDDICSIRLQSKSTKPLDEVKISYGTILLIQWGYVNGPISSISTIVVRDIDTNYGPNDIDVSLDCTDLVTYLKTARGDDSKEMSLIEYISRKIKDMRGYSYNVIIKEFGNIIYKQGAVKIEEPETNVSSFSNSPFVSNEATESEIGAVPFGNLEPSSKPKFVNFVKVNKPNTPVGGELSASASPQLLDFLTKLRPFTDANRSPYHVINDVLKYAPNGPWFVSGNGNNILIHNRDLAKAPTRTYTYKGEPGNLMSINIKSKYESFEQNAVSSPFMSPEDKISYYEDIYLKELDNIKDIKYILTNKEITEKERKELLQTFIATYKASKVWSAESLVVIQSSGIAGNFPQNEIDLSNNDEGGYLRQLKSGTVPADDTNNTKLAWSDDFRPSIGNALMSVLYMLPNQTADETRDMIDNIAREAEMDKVEAKLIVEGDPFMKAETVVRIKNIQSIHSGDYYLKKVEHVINSNGYKTQCDSLKIMPKAAVAGITVHSSIGPDGQVVIDRYHREQAMFTGWDMEVWVGNDVYGNEPGTDSFGAGTGQVSIKKYVPLSDFIIMNQDIPIDQLVTTILANGTRVKQPNVEKR